MHRVLLVLISLLPATAFAGPHRDAVLDLLNAYEGAPTEAQLKALGEGIDVELMEIADDASVPSSRRGRAVSALGFYRTEAVRAFLETRVGAAEKSLLRRKAVLALATGWGDGALPTLEKALADADVQVRLATVSALGIVGTDAAKAALNARLTGETEPAVRDAIEKTLGGTR